MIFALHREMTDMHFSSDSSGRLFPHTDTSAVMFSLWFDGWKTLKVKTTEPNLSHSCRTRPSSV